ncbi:hypothetical protein P8452_03894 [Trifolium repens]|nr:hypothetical protein P8452_03894 [Trifolium repens]
MWKDVLKSKYGVNATGMVKPWFSSVWWKYICSIGTNINTNWFSQGAVKHVGRGNQTKFWYNVWAGSVSLQERFPRLFSISIQKNSTVADLRVLEGGVAHWNLLWRRRLFVWEEELVTEPIEVINSVVISEDHDRWGWSFNGGGDFTVKSTYWSIVRLFMPMEPIGMIESKAFSSLWKCFAPSKVSVFALQLLLERIPTRQNLLRRHINLPEGEHCCVWCGSEPETVLHLFLYCDFAQKVWVAVFMWLRFDFILPHFLFSFLNFFLGSTKKKLKSVGLVKIWMAIVWVIWKMCNSVIFKNGVCKTQDSTVQFF